jgi:hypothetical protein
MLRRVKSMRAGVHAIEGGSGASADVHQGRRQRQRIALSGRAIPGEVDSVPERIGGGLHVAPEVRELLALGGGAAAMGYTIEVSVMVLMRPRRPVEESAGERRL